MLKVRSGRVVALGLGLACAACVTGSDDDVRDARDQPSAPDGGGLTDARRGDASGGAGGQGGAPGPTDGGSSGHAPHVVPPASATFVRDEDPCGRSRLPSLAPGEILDLGNQGGTGRVRLEGDRLVAMGTEGWTLWQISTRTQLAQGSWPEVPRPEPYGGSGGGWGEAVGSLFVTQKDATTYQLRSLEDGAVTATVVAPMFAIVGISMDGSYFLAAGTTGLSVWSREGKVLLSRPGDYGHARIAATPVELRVALGPAGNDRIELIDMASGASTITPPMTRGRFQYWMSDGEHFYAEGDTGAEWLLFAKTAGAPVIAHQFGYPVGGYGDYLWHWKGGTYGELEVVSMSRQLEVVATYQTAGSSSDIAYLGRGRLAVLGPSEGSAGDRVSVVDFTQTTPALGATPYTGDPWGLGIASDGHMAWPAGGHVETGDGTTLGCGWRGLVAGGEDGTLVVGTSLGLLLFALDDAGAQYLGRFKLDARRLEMSADGKVLALAARESSDYGVASVRTLSLETGEILHTWGRPEARPPGFNDPPDPDYVLDFSLARRADALALSFAALGPEQPAPVYLTNTRGESPTRVPNALPALRLSPTGAFLLSEQKFRRGLPGKLTKGADAGWDAGGIVSSWWSDLTYVARQYSRDGAGREILTDAKLFDLTGSVVPTAVPRDVDGNDDLFSIGAYVHSVVLPLQGDRVFTRTAGAVFDARTGMAVWKDGWRKGDYAVGAQTAAGPYVVVTAGSRVLIERY